MQENHRLVIVPSQIQKVDTEFVPQEGSRLCNLPKNVQSLMIETWLNIWQDFAVCKTVDGHLCWYVIWSRRASSRNSSRRPSTWISRKHITSPCHHEPPNWPARNLQCRDFILPYMTTPKTVEPSPQIIKTPRKLALGAVHRAGESQNDRPVSLSLGQIKSHEKWETCSCQIVEDGATCYPSERPAKVLVQSWNCDWKC